MRYVGDIAMAFTCIITGGFVLGYDAWPPFIHITAAANVATGVVLMYRAMKRERTRMHWE